MLHDAGPVLVRESEGKEEEKTPHTPLHVLSAERQSGYRGNPRKWGSLYVVPCAWERKASLFPCCYHHLCRALPETVTQHGEIPFRYRSPL